MATMHGLAQTIGYLTLSWLLYHVLGNIWIYFLRPSSLARYLHGKPASWALVTGASDGIGRSIAEELLRRGFNVFLHGRNEAKLSDLRTRLLKAHPARKIEVVVVDASQPNVDFDAIVAQVRNVDGKLTVLVNNVGGMATYPQYLPLDEAPPKDLEVCMAINATFPTRLIAALLPELKANKPSLIINCGSNAGEFGVPYLTTYSGTKAHMHVLSMALRGELKAQGVRDVEVMGIVIGNTATTGNKTHMAGGTITADECAKGMLNRVGCEYDGVDIRIMYSWIFADEDQVDRSWSHRTGGTGWFPLSSKACPMSCATRALAVRCGSDTRSSSKRSGRHGSPSDCDTDLVLESMSAYMWAR